MPSAANSPAPLSAPAMRAVSIVVRETLIAPISRSGGMMVGDQRAANAEVGRPHQAHDRDDDHHIERGSDSPSAPALISVAASTA